MENSIFKILCYVCKGDIPGGNAVVAARDAFDALSLLEEFVSELHQKGTNELGLILRQDGKIIDLGFHTDKKGVIYIDAGAIMTDKYRQLYSQNRSYPEIEIKT